MFKTGSSFHFLVFFWVFFFFFGACRWRNLIGYGKNESQSFGRGWQDGWASRDFSWNLSSYSSSVFFFQRSLEQSLPRASLSVKEADLLWNLLKILRLIQKHCLLGHGWASIEIRVNQLKCKVINWQSNKPWKLNTIYRSKGFHPIKNLLQTLTTKAMFSLEYKLIKNAKNLNFLEDLLHSVLGS